jgi:adenylate kinase
VSKLILLLGTSAAGKTTAGEAVAHASPAITYVYATATKLHLLRPGEALNLLDQRRTYEVNAAFFDGLPQGPEALLVDTHATYPFESGFVRLTPPSVCSRAAGIVFVDADPETIRSRRLFRGRVLEATDLAGVTCEMVAEREEVVRLRDAYDIPVLTIESTRVSVDDTVRTICDFVDAVPVVTP